MNSLSTYFLQITTSIFISNPIETEIIGANNLGDRLNKLRNILK